MRHLNHSIIHQRWRHNIENQFVSIPNYAKSRKREKGILFAISVIFIIEISFEYWNEKLRDFFQFHRRSSIKDYMRFALKKGKVHGCRLARSETKLNEKMPKISTGLSTDSAQLVPKKSVLDWKVQTKNQSRLCRNLSPKLNMNFRIVHREREELCGMENIRLS